MDQYETLNISQADGLLWIAFNRPKVLNAFNLAQWRDLKAALDSAAADDEVRVVAVRGEGGNFSAGYDLTAALGGDLAEPLPNAFRDYADVGNAACWAAPSSWPWLAISPTAIPVPNWVSPKSCCPTHRPS